MGSAGPSWKRRLGISAHVKDRTIEEMAALAGEIGAKYLEVVAERFWGLPDGGGEGRWPEIKELLARCGLHPFVHASHMEINLASLNPLLREAGLRQVLRCLELAAFLEAEFMVVHPGNLNRNYPPSYLPEARQCLLESLKTLAGRAESAGMTIALENGWKGENHPLTSSGTEHAELIESVGSTSLKALLDVGHAHTFGLDLSGHLDPILPYLVGLHLHDNNGIKDEHLPPGKGTIPAADFQRCFETGVPVVLELNSMEDIRATLTYLEANIIPA